MELILDGHLSQRPVSLKVHLFNCWLCTDSKKPAYHNLKGKVNLKVTGFKGATSKTFISFTRPLVLGNGLLSFIIPTSSPACLLWVQQQNSRPSMNGCFFAPSRWPSGRLFTVCESSCQLSEGNAVTRGRIHFSFQLKHGKDLFGEVVNNEEKRFMH